MLMLHDLMSRGAGDLRVKCRAAGRQPSFRRLVVGLYGMGTVDDCWRRLVHLKQLERRSQAPLRRMDLGRGASDRMIGKELHWRKIDRNSRLVLYLPLFRGQP